MLLWPGVFVMGGTPPWHFEMALPSQPNPTSVFVLPPTMINNGELECRFYRRGKCQSSAVVSHPRQGAFHRVCRLSHLSMPFARASLIIIDQGSAKYLPVILLLTIGFLLIFPKYISYDFPDESQSSHRYSSSWLSCSAPLEHSQAATKAGLIFSGVTNCSMSFFSERRFVVSIEWENSHNYLTVARNLAFYQLLGSIPGNVLRFMK
jgi:hypothetical protein